MALRISESNTQWCEKEMAEGRFSSFSEIAEFALRLYLYHIHRGISSIPKIPRQNLVRKTVRINEWVLRELLATGFFEQSEVADYAITFLRDYIDNRF